MNLPSERPDAVHVGLGGGVLQVAEIEPRLAADDARAHRGNRPAQRVAAKHPGLAEPGDRERQRDVTAGDRGGARSAVGDHDVAVDEDAPLAERLEVDRGAQAPADEPLDLLHASVHPALAPVALGAGLRAARQHRVLGGDPAASASPCERAARAPRRWPRRARACRPW